MNARMDEQMIEWMIGYENFFSLDFSFATFVRINVGPKCCNNLAALEQIILFLEMLKILLIKKILKEHNFEKKNEKSFGIFRNILFGKWDFQN
jgi:hypothetical protein